MNEKLDVARLKPNQYIHLLNNNANTTTLLIGPQNYTRLDHEYFTTPTPQPYVSVPPQKYCIVLNPVVRDPTSGAIALDSIGQAKLRLGNREIRFQQDPFPLYPGEVLIQDVTPLQTISATQALYAMCNCDFDETLPSGKVVRRKAGDEWVLRGPLTYYPRVEVDIKAVMDATVIKADQALKIRAICNFVDERGAVAVDRKAGEEWLVTDAGAFIPTANEIIVEVITAHVLTDRVAVHVGTEVNFTDRFGVCRAAGDAWLVTSAQTETFIPSPEERVLSRVALTVVSNRQYAIVEDANVAGKTVLGHRELRRGQCAFFLHPGESLSGGAVKNIYVLCENEALLLRSTQAFTDESGVARDPGARWLIRGPLEYVPALEVDVLEKRSTIPLDINEGVYIRNIRTGEVRAHIGKTVMLTEDEELWDKELDSLVEELLRAPKLTKVIGGTSRGAPAMGARVKSRVVACNVPHNALVQVFDYKSQRCRVFKGPDLVMLMPDEEFTVVSLSGGRPKKPDAIKTLCLQLGPDFMADEMIIETLDHARLQLVLSYNWEFDTNVAVDQGKAFSIPDFVGDACKAIASRIRGFVSSETFDSFHRNSSNIIKLAVFGLDPDTGNLYPSMKFDVNGLRITNVDVHSVDPVDPKTREALTKSVQLAIEITTKSQEAIAIQQATSLEQEAKGKLERQIILDKSSSETERRRLLEVEAENAAVESTGASKAQAAAVAEALLIEGQSEVDLAEKRSMAMETNVDAELGVESAKNAAELDFRQAIYDLEVHKARESAAIEAEKFRKTIAAVGKDTIKAIARAGPELQAKLLSGLGLQGYLVTDGTNPINLFNTAKGMTAAATGKSI
jgi:major vault protein